ncbi:acyltransferase [Pseudarthrobacter sp. C1]|uniref:acyltransferase family protein n=1 Tax=Pseudarthrobacter sp. C1 TaxID=3108940 RepID=UPI002B056DF1|nr:acyltransferase [Pseudarthrobacter sp. C1]MEA3550264.1 acyltransferase [Pseudarthrobacter sp. C1]
MKERLQGLDGLRGIAALIVLSSHTLLIFRSVAGGSERSASDQAEPWIKTALQSPLHVIYAGGEAVFVFFILSGFVLVLPFLQRRPPSWIGYYPKRLLRLYVPILGAVIMTAAMVLAIPRVVSSDQTWWVNMHAIDMTFKGLIRESFTLLGTGRYNSVLWSLKWEIILSLFLPIYVVVARSMRSWWLLGAGVMILLSAAGLSMGNTYLEYLPMFGIGAFLAAGRDKIVGLADRHSVGKISMTVAAAMFSAYWSIPGLPLPRVCLLIACTALLIAFLTWTPALGLSRTHIMKWLASRSFSLYLVHEPIIVSAALVFPSRPWLSVAVGWPVAILATELFFKFIEDPSRRLANWGGCATTDRLMPRASAKSQE